jgi:hypothetical protein
LFADALASGILINNLRVGTTANFYKLRRRLTGASIAELFRQLRATARSPSQNLFRHERERSNGAVWSAIAFFQEHDPVFLRPPPPQSERSCAYVLIVEHRGHAATFKSRLEVPSTFKSMYLDRVAPDRIEAVTAQADAIFEKIRLRNMSPSALVLRSKTLEAGDLSNSVGPSGASRYAPQSYATRRGGSRFSTTLNTGRISKRADMARYREAIQWACRLIDELNDAHGETAAFLRTFARPVDLRAAGPSLRPRSFTANAAALAEILFEEGSHRLVRADGGQWLEIQRDGAETILEALDQVLPVRTVRGEWRILEPNGRSRAGKLRLNATRIALRSLDRPVLRDVWVETSEHPVGADPERTSLRNFIDQNNHFLVLFEDASLAYLFGALYRDDAFAAGDETLLRYLQADGRLVQATSEKGVFAAGQTEFSDTSVFRVIVDEIARSDTTLVCDDLSDEWADFIGLNDTGNVPVLSFYHAKQGALSLGASPFHVAVSQAIKNLGRLALPEDRMPTKIDSWRDTYANDGVETDILRVIRGGDTPALLQTFQEARLAPAIVRRVCIVTSSLSRQQVADALEAVRNGDAPKAHFVQLYWLLLSFFSACSEVGAVGGVICQP